MFPPALPPESLRNASGAKKVTHPLRIDTKPRLCVLVLPLPQGLSKLLGDHAPGCVKENKFESYFGRAIAIDASMHIYQFMVGGALGRRQPNSTPLVSLSPHLLRLMMLNRFVCAMHCT